MAGEVVRVGMRTPWGTADSARMMVEGIGQVGTPGHGGIKLDAARNRQVPSALRRQGGWYEEDCDVYIPLYVFSHELRTAEQTSCTAEEAWRGMLAWYPEQVAQAYPAGRAEQLAERIRPVAPAVSLVNDDGRRALDRTDDHEVLDGPEHVGDRCATCNGHGVVRCSGKRYRTAARAQEAVNDGRAQDCPTCKGTGEEDLPALLQAAKDSGHLQVITVGR